MKQLILFVVLCILLIPSFANCPLVYLTKIIYTDDLLCVDVFPQGNTVSKDHMLLTIRNADNKIVSKFKGNFSGHNTFNVANLESGEFSVDLTVECYSKTIGVFKKL